MSEETVLLTYAELAERLGIDEGSAKKRVRRKLWPRVIGNDRKARVRVPVSVLLSPVVSGDVPGDINSPVSLVVPPSVAFLEGQLEGVRGQLETANRLTEEAQKRADAAEVRERSAQDELASFKRVSEVNIRELKADRHQYRHLAEALRRELEGLQEAERVRQGRSWWSRLLNR